MCAVTARPAAFLDRDGTVNAKAPDGDYITHPGQVRLLLGASGAIRRLNDAGVLVIIVTNQRGIALRRMTEADLAAVHAKIAAELLSSAGAEVDLFLHCPHEQGECDCRKPATGMLREACRLLPEVELGRSVLIGDALSDVQAGQRFGLRTMHLGVDVPNLSTAVEIFLDVCQAHVRGRVGTSQSSQAGESGSWTGGPIVAGNNEQQTA